MNFFIRLLSIHHCHSVRIVEKRRHGNGDAFIVGRAIQLAALADSTYKHVLSRCEPYLPGLCKHTRSSQPVCLCPDLTDPRRNYYPHSSTTITVILTELYSKHKDINFDLVLHSVINE